MNPVVALTRAADLHDRGLHFTGDDGTTTTRSWSRLRDDAARVAHGLVAAGVRPGDRVATVLSEPLEMVSVLLGVLWLGATLVPLSPLAGLTRDGSYDDHVTQALVTARTRLVVTSEEGVPGVATLELPEACQGVVAAAELLVTWSDQLPARATDTGDLALLQFTSGSTGRPRPVEVTVGNLAACLDGIVARSRIDTRTRGVSWLPLHHDMGLISVLTTTSVLHEATVMTPLQFVRDPLGWLDTVDRERASLTLAPPFALALVAKRLRALPELPSWDLSCLTSLVVGGEPVNVGVLRDFLEATSTLGVAPDVLAPSYGAAEATLTVTSPSRRLLVTDEVDPAALSLGRAVPAASGRVLVGCGPALPGVDVRIVDTGGQALPDRTVGSVAFRGPSITGDGWREPGDLGYLVDGELFLTGRSRDLLIVRGRNHDPQTIEWVVEAVPGVRKGCVAAFTVPGLDTELVVVALETSVPSDGLVAELRSAVARAHQLAVHDVVLLASGTLGKTTSGKVQRQLARERYLAERVSQAGGS